MPMPEPASEQSIFLDALALPAPADRAAFLDKACRDNSGLRAEVEALLAAHDRLGGGLPRTTGTDPAGPGPGGEEVGAVLSGRYKLVELLGEGGMGAVWMAQQTEPVRRLVAVKVVKAGMDSKQILARFEAERQALALMDHPNIAKVLDAGTTPSGRPYFVMELVKGVPITRYCDEQRLAPRQRLELFVPVCQAVQHAHQKGIIHRDIKPSNVLVAPYDGRPVVKVIDFGVAKAAGQPLTERTLITGFGAIVGTLEYMSPEQAELNNQDIDTRSDVYSLGVLLYELLTGTTPLEKRWLKEAAMLEVLRLIREQEPPRPSTRLSTTDALPSLAANRGLEPKKLSGLVKGELDWIALKALEKDRNRRYESASAFAADVQRYLADEPVLACPPSAGYRLRKFARKNRAALTTMATIALVLVAGIAVSTWQAFRATWAEQKMGKALGQARQAKAQADKALNESEEARRQAQAVTKYLVKLFRSPDPSQDGRDIKLADLLDRAPAELDANLAGSAKMKAELLAALGDTYQGLGLPDKAVEVYEKARALREATLGPDDAATLDTMTSLASAYNDAKRPAEAIALTEKALPRYRIKFGADHPGTLTAASILGDAYRAAERPDDAIRLLEPSLKRCRSKLGPDHSTTLDTMNNLALAYKMAGRLPKAVALFEETLNLEKAKLGLDHPETLITTNNLAGSQVADGRPGHAIRLLEPSLKRCRTKLGRDHPTTLDAMNDLALAYLVAGRLPKAVALFEETLNRMKAKLGPDHLETLNTTNNLSDAYGATGRPSDAIRLLKPALKRCQSKLGPRHPVTLSAMHRLGRLYLDVGKVNVALPLFEETLKLQRAKLGPDHPDTLMTMGYLAVCYWKAKRLNKSIPLFEEALRRREKTLGRKHPTTISAVMNLGVNYRDAGRVKEALSLLEEAYRGRSRLGRDLDTCGLMNSLAVAYWQDKQLDKSIPLFEEELKLREKKLGRAHPQTLVTVLNLGMNYGAAGRLKEAVPLLKEAYRGWTKLNPKDPNTIISMDGLARAYSAAGKWALALPLREGTLHLQKSTLGPDHPDTLYSMGELGYLHWRMKKFEKAIMQYEEKWKLEEKKLGRDHPETLSTAANLGANYKAAGRLKEAIPFLEEAYRAGRKIPDLAGVTEPLIEAYTRAGENAKLTKLLQEQLSWARQALPKDRPRLAGLFAKIGLGLLAQQKWAQAEPLLRECLAIRAKQEPDDWRTFNTRSMLGEALLGQKKYAAAGPLLLAGYEGMKEREKKIPPQGRLRLPEAAERLIELYKATNKPEALTKWQAERAKYPPARKAVPAK
jgi:serine/threonine protein kinase/tetratricopeptide (TPR) repeat protein